MLQAVHIARYRGIRELAANGFSRVNLIVGKNDCGKTAFMEALQLTDEAENAAHFLLFDQRDRLGRTTQSHDFDRFWRPMFFGLDATACQNGKAGMVSSTMVVRWWFSYSPPRLH